MTIANTPRRIAGYGLLASTIVVGAASGASAQSTIPEPGVVGDQLIFFYDARTNRTPFLTVSNPGSSPVIIEVAFYGETLGARLGQEIRTLPGAGNTVIDPTEAAGGSANGSQGLAVVTAVKTAGDPTPVVPPEPLTGGFTLANTALQAAFGENALGRLAVDSSNARAQAGRTIDGSQVKYQRFTPNVLMVPAYFNPTSLAPPEQDGNRVIVVAFDDQYSQGAFNVAGKQLTAQATFTAGNGSTVTTTSVPVSGVLSSNLQALAQGATLNSSGKVFLDVDAGSGNVFGIFSQSLGTFASGQRLPAVDGVPGSAS